jgi:peptidoglycan L-alanyl-D-glutamate endopeptidase CwlK
MASRSKKNLNEILVDAYEKACEEYAMVYPNLPQPFLTCTFRPNDEQAELFHRPHDGKDNNNNGIIDDRSEKVTQAEPGESPHNYDPAPAFDIAFINPLTQKLDWNPSNFKLFADIITRIQPLIFWGGHFKSFNDAPHFELRGWRKYIKQAA